VKSYGGEEVHLHLFLTLALEGGCGEWSASCTSCFICGDFSPHDRGLSSVYIILLFVFLNLSLPYRHVYVHVKSFSSTLFGIDAATLVFMWIEHWLFSFCLHSFFWPGMHYIQIINWYGYL
jgi:hypothetical protein